MILKEKAPDVLVSGNFKETDFSMDDSNQHIIFDILRSKVYKNNIGAICREIASNSRDAQREIGDYNTPVEIEIADRRKSFLYEDGLNIIFRDRGVGLSPDRVANIYTKYGASTKRDSNNQTGGFGLGAKTPFSYSDAFIVRTVVDNIEYVYSIYIDVSRKGKMALLFQEELQHQGNLTEIIIPVKEQDLPRFSNEIIKNTHFWPVRPKLINFTKTYSELDKITTIPTIKYSVSGDYLITRKNNFIESEVNAIIDGIYYPIDTKIVNLNFYGYNFAICLFYNNGELNISANRETLQYDDDTIQNIVQRVNKIQEDFRNKYEESIRDCKSVYLAQYAINKLNKEDSLFGFICKTKTFEYIDKTTSEKFILQENKRWRPQVCKIFFMRKYFDKIEKSFVENVFNPTFYDNVDNIYWINQADNDLHKSRFSGPINRTLVDKHPNGFLIIVENSSIDKNIVFDKTIFDANLVEDKKKIFDQYKLEVNDYWQVPPTKIKPVKKQKKETITVKSFYNGNYNRSSQFKFENGFFTEAGVANNNIIYYYVDEERTLDKDLKSALEELSKVINTFDNYTQILIASKLKKKYFGNYKTVEEYIASNEAPIFKLYERYTLSDSIQQAKQYKNINFDKIIKDELDILYNLEKMKEIEMSSIIKFIRSKMPKFVLVTKKFDDVFDKIQKFYPMIDCVYSTHVKQYVDMANDLIRCKKLLGEI